MLYPFIPSSISSAKLLLWCSPRIAGGEAEAGERVEASSGDKSQYSIPRPKGGKGEVDCRFEGESEAMLDGGGANEA
jgi:hypothetical protein